MVRAQINHQHHLPSHPHHHLRARLLREGVVEEEGGEDEEEGVERVDEGKREEEEDEVKRRVDGVERKRSRSKHVHLYKHAVNT